MKFILKNPAPSDSRRQKWGDFHFGRSLSKYLERLGHEVVTHYDPSWHSPEPADVVLVLRGKYPYPDDGGHPGAVRVLWNISHPASVTMEEYTSHDLVCVASAPLAAELSGRLDVPVVPLLQCTDAEEFGPPSTGEDRRHVVFIGNTRDMERPGVLWGLDYGLDVRIWGRGWSSFGVDADHVMADYVANEELGALYGRARVTLNDHWDDMKHFGFVNNRILDALACGLPVISDHHDQIEALVDGGVLMHKDRAGFERCVERYLLEYPSLLAEAAAASSAVRAAHTFEVRAADLVRLITPLLGEG